MSAENLFYTTYYDRQPTFYQSIIRGTDLNPQLCPAQELLPSTEWIRNMFEDPRNPAMMTIPAEIRAWSIQNRSKYYQNAPTPEIRSMIERKIFHSQNVNNKSYELASASNSDFFWNFYQVQANADLHDAGRFPQAFYFGTFNDQKSFNHAQVSADMALYANLPLRRYGCTEALTFGPVEEHSQIDCTNKPYFHILRDADKIIIGGEYKKDLELLIQSGKFQQSELDSEAEDYFLNKKAIPNKVASKNLTAKILQRLGWKDGFYLDAAKRDFAQSGITEQLLSLLADVTGSSNTAIEDSVFEWQNEVLSN